MPILNVNWALNHVGGFRFRNNEPQDCLDIVSNTAVAPEINHCNHCNHRCDLNFVELSLQVKRFSNLKLIILNLEIMSHKIVWISSATQRYLLKAVWQINHCNHRCNLKFQI